MTVKKMYKVLHKAFPNADIFVLTKGTARWLAIPSTPMRLFGKCKVADIIKDYDIENNMPIYFIKVE